MVRKGLMALAAISALLNTDDNAQRDLNKELNKVNRRHRMKRTRSYASYLEDMNNDNLSDEDKQKIEKAKLKQVMKNEKRRMASKNK